MRAELRETRRDSEALQFGKARQNLLFIIQEGLTGALLVSRCKGQVMLLPPWVAEILQSDQWW